MTVQLSNNFTLTEFTKSQAGARLGIDNTPQGEHLENLKNLVTKIIQPLREQLGKPITINSGYRGPEVNKAVGGAATSQHCLGEAADIECPGMANADLAHYIQQHFDFDQLILEFYKPGIPDSGWVHVSLKRNDPQRKQCLTAVSENGKTVYKPGFLT
ncbi:hypothetical protein EBR43_07345 [bacterium]|nr:hypothetical protein [bacterium]